MSGVIVRDRHLQIDLRAQGFGRERLEIEPTPVNIKYAERLRLEILGKIERGTFALGDYFPNSPRVAKDAPSMTWAEVAAEWKKVKRGEIEHSTAHSYAQTLSSKHFTDWQGLRMNALDYRALMAKLAALPQHPKTWNNIASVLSMVLEYASKAKLLREPLHQHVEMRRAKKPLPDPFTLEEVELMLSKMRNDRGRLYYEFAFFSGLRPSEQIALRWSKVDFKRGTVTIDTAFTRSAEKGTKTGVSREVELTGRALAVLEEQRAVSHLAGDHVFLGMDNLFYTTTKGPLDGWWKPAMKLSGLRHRDARQTRHTFATVCLHAGSTPAWVARQLGHSVEMFYRVYSKWIEAADAGSEVRRLNSFLSGQKTGTQTGT
ncbi:site-specific integrase [Pseudorhodoferax sp. Leaf274]|uniref:site-specific integrase n=1 Tax=Pseudorhodoferax sp. Leaf274 TaxID=1736318 RepID=UPI000702FF51|nr:site-specific integrase [Pseudorhodoferax sp. Leaf274]KQP43955.1 integrase [Pseudorhodoferax sp. Leaf274]